MLKFLVLLIIWGLVCGFYWGVEVMKVWDMDSLSVWDWLFYWWEVFCEVFILLDIVFYENLYYCFVVELYEFVDVNGVEFFFFF